MRTATSSSLRCGRTPRNRPARDRSRALRERILGAVRAEAELLRAAGPQADEPPRAPRRRLARPPPMLTACVGIAASVVIAAAIAVGIGSPATEQVVSAQVAATVSGARASLRRVAGRAELAVSDMPQPPLGRIYQVWLNRGEGPRPTDALFSVTRRGSGSVNVPGSLHGADRGGGHRASRSEVARARQARRCSSYRSRHRRVRRKRAGVRSAAWLDDLVRRYARSRTYGDRSDGTVRAHSGLEGEGRRLVPTGGAHYIPERVVLATLIAKKPRVYWHLA